jgi:hypothetical protein
MRAAGDGKELGQALKETQDHGTKEIHRASLPKRFHPAD